MISATPTVMAEILTPLSGKMDAARRVMVEGADILDSLGVTWWLASGTLLGVVREGELIAHDTDIDVAAVEPVNRSALAAAFFDAGFEVCRFMPFQRAFHKERVAFDIYFYEEAGDTMVCHTDFGRLVEPARLMDPLGTVTYEGRDYPAPDPVDEYLTVRYGDWRTPKTAKVPWFQDAANLEPA